MRRTHDAEIRLEAIAAAKRLHRGMDIKSDALSRSGMVDVFRVIEKMGIPLVFKPLDSALGFCLPKPLRGIMITTRRGLHIQRFTAAHELGHAVLGHSGSVDQEVNYRAGFDEPNNSSELQEMAADAFAAEFLLPRWLYKHHIRQQEWTVNRHLVNPDIVYQLSLRMGASYEATCWGLVNHRILRRSQVETLLETKVASIKQRAGEGFRATSSWANSWRVSSKDNGSILLGGCDDLFCINLDDFSGEGSCWCVDDLKDTGFTVVSDKKVGPDGSAFSGIDSRRVLVARAPERKRAKIRLSEVQGYHHFTSRSGPLEIFIDLSGKETGGWSQSTREVRGASVM